MATTTIVAVRNVWGTWEELVLGGAVLRYGPQAWDVVSAELRARTVSPCSFTPEACKDKYDDLQKQYTGCTALFEELRKRRVEQLKEELEKADNNIGSLELKLKSLKSEKGDSNHSQVHHGSCETNSPAPLLKPEHMESSCKEASNEVISASSISQVIKTAAEPEIKHVSKSSEQKASPTVEKLVEKDKTVQKRKRKDSKGNIQQISQSKNSKNPNCKERPVKSENTESENLGSTTVASSSISDCDQTTRNNDLLALFDSIAQNKHALVFQHRLDNQKTAKYRRVISQHMDFDTIKSRITSSSIRSMRKLFRDMLLVTTNALSFYSGKMPEYTSAVLLRKMLAEAYEQHFNKTSNILSSFDFLLSPIYNPPVKPRSSRPRNPRSLNQPSNFHNLLGLASQEQEKGNNTEIVEKNPKRKIVGQNCRKVNHANRVSTKKQDGPRSDERRQVTNPMKGKKRVRKM
ncbi:uncharacterized protein LOC124931798 [Impatiens glandulifera]|uniref:uncharacterized protein LOC124931798 n=1 Tax=Impatiens glandulifera TaxID=253017 RepID=UPI001FB0C2EC|nr:uncharacterized protein LOC124931798 [Impatiens glandulifera]